MNATPIKSYNCLQVLPTNPEDAECSSLLQGHTRTVYALASSKKKPRVWSGSYDRTIRCFLWLWEEEGSDRALLFSGSGDHNIKAWDVDSLECVATLEGHKYDVRALTVVGSRLFSGCYDLTIKIWDIERLECMETIAIPTGPPFALRVHEPTNRLLSGGWNKAIDVYDLETLKIVSSLEGIEGHTSLVYCLELDADKNMLFSGSIDNTIKVWDVRSNVHVKTLKGHSLGVNSLVLSGNYLYSGSDDRTIRTWDIRRLEGGGGGEALESSCVSQAPHGVKALCLASDGRHLWAGIESDADCA